MGDELGQNCPKKFVGYVETTSRFVASAYEDHRLFFQHERLITKGGRWSRKRCNSNRNLNSESEYRMAGDYHTTCTHECLGGTKTHRTLRAANDTQDYHPYQCSFPRAYCCTSISSISYPHNSRQDVLISKLSLS